MQSNIQKIFLYIFTGRRNFWPLVPIFYLTLPGSSLVHLGVFSAISMAVGFASEIPTGYLSDRIGHKQTLVLGKISMVISTIILLLGQSFGHFAIYYVFFALALALRSGTLQAFCHETFEALGKGGNYGMIMSKIKGNASLLSVALIILYPVLFSISPYWAFGTALIIDIIGLIVACLLVSPTIDTKKVAKNVRSILYLLAICFKAKSFLIVAGIASFARIIFYAQGPFKEPYLIELGYPVALIGLVMGLSRFFWFVFGRAFGELKSMFSLKKLIAMDFIVMSIGFGVIALAQLPWYLMGFIVSLVIGFYYGRASLYTHYLLAFIPDKEYKATFLSIKGFIESLLGIVLPVAVGYAMVLGYQIGYLVIAGLYMLVGFVGYFLVSKYIGKKVAQ